MKKLNIAIAGLGTVGCGTYQLLKDNAASIEESIGTSIHVVAVSARDRDKPRPIDLAGVRFVEDTLALADLPDVDVVVELIGGIEGVAKNLCEKALSNGKSVVTANKAMLAHHGVALGALAEKNDVSLSFEAAACGGIPIIKTMREAMVGNRILSVQGIMNGTCNYILTRMARDHLEFADVLAQAQALGYAEADPTADVDGFDTAHKLCILTALSFGVKPTMASVSIEGIRRISSVDLAYAAELGYRLKLLGVAKLHKDGIEQRVSPCLVPLSSTLASVDEVLNAVQLQGDAVGPLNLIGRGAGAQATASAVVGDLIDLARGHKVNPWIRPSSSLTDFTPLPLEGRIGRWYLRLQVTDKAGVLADIAAILRDNAISIESLLQRGKQDGTGVPVIIVTHQTNEAKLRAALAQMAVLDTVWEEPLCLRIEQE
ncbi:MAG TPA: homoserine dehydrogenase [Rhodospirillaceae bacterium]|nr:homoserine dehydrogenase [Rhodospirillaceae bacterium]